MYPELPNVPEIVDIPYATYIMARGRGPWNDPDGTYAQASRLLRNVRKELTKLSPEIQESKENAPLETFWWQQGAVTLDLDDKESFVWSVAMRVGDISDKVFYSALKTVSEQKSLDCRTVFLSTISEGTCAQIRHVGSYDNEKATIALMEDFIAENGYKTNPYGYCPHHEIFIPLKEKDKRGQWDTIFRRPICRR